MKSFHEWSDDLNPRADNPGNRDRGHFGGTDMRGLTGYQDNRGFSHEDIKKNPQEREAQKRELEDIADKGKKAEKFLAYINSVEHMSRSGLEF